MRDGDRQGGGREDTQEGERKVGRERESQDKKNTEKEGEGQRETRSTVVSQVSAHGRLEFTGKKRGWVLTRRSHLYVHCIYVHTNHQIIKMGGECFIRRWMLTRDTSVERITKGHKEREREEGMQFDGYNSPGQVENCPPNSLTLVLLCSMQNGEMVMILVSPKLDSWTLEPSCAGQNRTRSQWR